MVSETKIDMSFPTSQFVIQSFAAPFRLYRTNTGGGILVHVRDDIPSKLLNTSYVSSDTECLAIEILKPFIYRFAPDKLLKKFSRYTGN